MSKVTKEEALRYLDVIANFEPNDEWNAKMLDEYHELKKYINQQHNTNITVSDKELEEAIQALSQIKKGYNKCVDFAFPIIKTKIAELEEERNYFKRIALNKVDMNIELVDNKIVELPTYEQIKSKLDKIREVIDERADTSPYHFKPLPYYFKTIKSILESED